MHLVKSVFINYKNGLTDCYIRNKILNNHYSIDLIVTDHMRNDHKDIDQSVVNFVNIILSNDILIDISKDINA